MSNELDEAERYAAKADELSRGPGRRELTWWTGLATLLRTRSSTAHAAGYAEGIEAAAKRCDEFAQTGIRLWAEDETDRADLHLAQARGAQSCAAAIRALSPPSPSAQPAGAVREPGTGNYNDEQLDHYAAIEPAAPQAETVAWLAEHVKAGDRRLFWTRAEAEAYAWQFAFDAYTFTPLYASPSPSPVAGVDVTEAIRDALHFITNIDNAHPVVRKLRTTLAALNPEKAR